MRRPAAAIALSIVLAACAAKPPPQLDLAGQACTANVDLAGARALALDAKDEATASPDRLSPCVRAVNGVSTYVVFRLPDSVQPYLVAVTSAPIGEALFAPRLLVLDGDGNLLRELGRDRFLFHGASLAAGFRAVPAERFLVVASDPGSLGQQVSQVVDSIHTQTVATGLVVFQVYSGSEATRTLVYAYNGTITVSAKSLAATLPPLPRP